METTTQNELLIENEKNKLTVRCQYCNSIILSPKMGKHVTLQKKLPFMTQKKDVVVNEGEELLEFWSVEDMFTFENIGFTHTVDDIKYLTCADCEMGPIGFHVLSTKESFVALERIKHEES